MYIQMPYHGYAVTAHIGRIDFSLFRGQQKHLLFLRCAVRQPWQRYYEPLAMQYLAEALAFSGSRKS